MTAEDRLTAAAPGEDASSLIVVGVHGTAASAAAAEWGVREARLRGARVHLVLARDPAATHRAGYARRAAAAADSAASDRLGQTADWAARMLSPERVTAETANGLPARVLMDRAVGACLLVLGSARTADFIGPVARACLRQAPCPVVIIAADHWRSAEVPAPQSVAVPAATVT